MQLERPCRPKLPSSFSPTPQEAWPHEIDTADIGQCVVSTVSRSRHWRSECVRYDGGGYLPRSCVLDRSEGRSGSRCSAVPCARTDGCDAVQPVWCCHLMLAQKRQNFVPARNRRNHSFFGDGHGARDDGKFHCLFDTAAMCQ